jgi:hypothetical protein
MRAELRQKFKDHQRPQVQRRCIEKEVKAFLEAGNKESAKKTIVDFIIEVNSLIPSPSYTTQSPVVIIEQGVNSSGAVLLRSDLLFPLDLPSPFFLFLPLIFFPAPLSLLFSSHFLLT